MPFKSYAQQRAMFKSSPRTAREWAHKYGVFTADGVYHPVKRRLRVKRGKRA
jgi:hypothetical protein